jgi:hypothetical protein
MARFRLTSAYYFDAVGRLSAGTVVASPDTHPAFLGPGIIILQDLTADTLPRGFTPIDAEGEVMRNASRWADTPCAISCTGGDSI